MSQVAYLIGLCLSLIGLAILDHRLQLALFFDRRRSLIVLALGIVFFVAWDLLGIAAGIFSVGDSAYLTGLRLAPEFPVEELFFLALLVYTALLLVRGSEKLWPRM